jgi:hypothetical protein
MMFAKIYGDNDSVDINSRQTVFSMFLVGVIAPEVFIVQPGFVQGLVELLGFDDRGAGYTASAEMWGLAATTILMTFIPGQEFRFPDYVGTHLRSHRSMGDAFRL